MAAGGAVVLSNGTGDNTYSGTTEVQSGATLQAGAINALSPDSATTLDASGTLNLGGHSNTLLSLASDQSSSQVVLGGGVLTLNGGATTSFAGSIQDAAGLALTLGAPCGGLTIAGGTDLTLTNGSNSYCGATRVENGTLNIFASGALPSATSVTILGSGVLNLEDTNSAVSLTNGGSVSNTGIFHTASLINTGTFSNANPGPGASFLGNGSGSSFTISGGTLTNGTPATTDPSVFGDSDTSLSFSGGNLNNNNGIVCTTYTQDSGATLTSIFSEVMSATQYGSVTASENITLGGHLVAQSYAGFPQPFNMSFVLLQTVSPYRVEGSFASESSTGFTSAPNFVTSLRAVSLFFAGCDSDWIDNTASGNRGASGNWGGVHTGIMGNADDLAFFSDTGGALTEDITVTLANSAGNAALPITLYQLDFSTTDSAYNYTIEQYSSESTITFDSNSEYEMSPAVPLINVYAGAPTIDAPMILNEDTELLLADGTQMTFESNASLTSTAGILFTVGNLNSAPLGSGTLINNATLRPLNFLSTLQQWKIILRFQQGIFGHRQREANGNLYNGYFYNNSIGAMAKTTEPSSVLIIGGLGSTTVVNIESGTQILCGGAEGAFLITSSTSLYEDLRLGDHESLQHRGRRAGYRVGERRLLGH